jgi:hypothetical protein
MLYAVEMKTPPEPANTTEAASTPTVSAQKQRCFVIAPIGKDGSETRKKSDNVLKYIVEKALEDKYEVKRADDIRQPGTVTVQIIEQLLEAPLVVADLSDWNANVYYELAIRHAAKKPVVHLITKGQEAPFDVSQMRYVSYDITDPGSVDNAKQELRDHVQALGSATAPLTPIQFTQFVLAAQPAQSGNSDAGMIAKVIDTAMSNISEELKSIKELVVRTRSASGLTFLDPNYLAALGDMGIDFTDDYIAHQQAVKQEKAQQILQAKTAIALAQARANANRQEQEKTEKKD